MINFLSLQQFFDLDLWPLSGVDNLINLFLKTAAHLHHLTMTFSLTVFLVMLLTAIALLCRDRILLRCRDKQIKHLELELQEKEKKLLSLLEEHQEQEAFAEHLSKASITTKLQQPRLDPHRGAQPAPEKYSFLPRLAARGLTLPEIAELLAMSTTETSQLLHLAKISAMTKSH